MGFDLTADHVVTLHGILFGITPQQAVDRLRSRDVLEGAVGRPRQHAHYARADLATQAAVLAHGIAEGQSFVDGNKRTALVALVTFLELNGYTIATSEGVLAAQILSLSDDRSVEDLDKWIRSVLVERAQP